MSKYFTESLGNDQVMLLKQLLKREKFRYVFVGSLITKTTVTILCDLT
jgi:hypothetical protein